MCGIAGILGRDPIRGLAAILDGFSRALVHRGPDDAGFLAWAPGQAVRPVGAAGGLADAPDHGQEAQVQAR
jgi:asparagine synthetase B (glutamine-hydrolysing)